MAWLHRPFTLGHIVHGEFGPSVSTEAVTTSRTRFSLHGITVVNLVANNQLVSRVDEVLQRYIALGLIPSHRPPSLPHLEEHHQASVAHTPVHGESGLSHVIGASLFLAVNMTLEAMGYDSHWYPTNNSVQDLHTGYSGRRTDWRLNKQGQGHTGPPLFELKTPTTSDEIMNAISEGAKANFLIRNGPESLDIIDPVTPDTPVTGKVKHIILQIMGALLTHGSEYAILSNYDLFILFRYDHASCRLEVSSPIRREGGWWEPRGLTRSHPNGQPILSLQPFCLLLAISLDALAGSSAPPSVAAHAFQPFPGAYHTPYGGPHWPSQGQSGSSAGRGGGGGGAGTTFSGGYPHANEFRSHQSHSQFQIQRGDQSGCRSGIASGPHELREPCHHRGETGITEADITRPRTPSASLSLRTTTDASPQTPKTDEGVLIESPDCQVNQKRRMVDAPTNRAATDWQVHLPRGSFIIDLKPFDDQSQNVLFVPLLETSRSRPIQHVAISIEAEADCVSHWSLGPRRGSGSVWTVYEISHRPAKTYDSEPMIIKLFPVTSTHVNSSGWTQRDCLEAIRTEWTLLEGALKHPDLGFVVCSKGVYGGTTSALLPSSAEEVCRRGSDECTKGGKGDGVDHPPSGSGTWGTFEYLAMVMPDAGMERCPTDLSLLTAEEKAEIIAHYTTLGKHRILHGDAHPRNWIRTCTRSRPTTTSTLTDSYLIKVIDWGLARLVKPGSESGDRALRWQLEELHRALELNDVYQLSAPQSV